MSIHQKPNSIYYVSIQVTPYKIIDPELVLIYQSEYSI